MMAINTTKEEDNKKSEMYQETKKIGNTQEIDRKKGKSIQTNTENNEIRMKHKKISTIVGPSKIES